MRLLFVVQRYGADALGGAERHCREFATLLAARGHQVEVATSCARKLRGLGRRLRAGRVRRPRRAGEPLPGRCAPPGPIVRSAAPTGRRFARPGGACRRARVDADVGPRAAGSARWLRGAGRRLRRVIFFTYLYATTFDGLETLTGLTPCVLHPLAHDEPALGLALFDHVPFHRRLRLQHGGGAATRRPPVRDLAPVPRDRRRDRHGRASTTTTTSRDSGSASGWEMRRTCCTSAASIRARDATELAGHGAAAPSSWPRRRSSCSAIP